MPNPLNLKDIFLNPESTTSLLADELFEIIGPFLSLKAKYEISKIRSMIYENQDFNINKESLPSKETLRFIKFYLEFNHICKRFHRVHLHSERGITEELDQKFDELLKSVNPLEIEKALSEIQIDFVFTAHPTEIFEHKVLKKYISIHKNLARNYSVNDKKLLQKLRKERKAILLSLWFTSDYRSSKPNPKDEAKLGQMIYQYSIWNGWVQFRKEMNSYLKSKGLNPHTNHQLISFSSWMGGDRDGNPFVTAKLTTAIIKSFSKKSIHLYFRELKRLKEDLSFEVQFQGKSLNLEDKIESCQKLLTHVIKSGYKISKIQSTESKLKKKLNLIFKALNHSHLKFIANRRLRALIERIENFGLLGLRWDIRQDSQYHNEVMDELFEWNGQPFSKLNEPERLSWIKDHSKNLADLIQNDLPKNSTYSSKAIDFIETIQLISRYKSSVFPFYIISMTQSASDLVLIQKLIDLAGGDTSVVPLFETLEDLENSSKIVDTYLKVTNFHKKSFPVMLGYSDSAKTGSHLSSIWNLYKAQKDILNVTSQKNIECQFFHGRGGSIGRGGGPVPYAIASCPIHAIKKGFRMTIQGEVIWDQFGLEPLVSQSLKTYLLSLLVYRFSPRKKNKNLKEQENIVSFISESSKKKYRELIYETGFFDYFESVTPVNFMGDLNIGSRPSKRESGKKSYRAIPWIFGWTQNRSLLPTWYGAGTALKEACDTFGIDTLKNLYQNFFLFQSSLDLIYMAYLKIDLKTFEKYDESLSSNSKFLKKIKNEYQLLENTLLKIIDPQKGSNIFLKDRLSGRLKILNFLNTTQVELLKKIQKDSTQNFSEPHKTLLLLTMQALSSGMGNTG